MRSGAWGTWDRDHVGLAKPIIYNDEMFIYYAGSNVPMGSNAPGHQLADVINTVRDGQWMAHPVRFDVSAHTTYYVFRIFSVLSRGFPFAGLVSNARCQTMSGNVRLEATP